MKHLETTSSLDLSACDNTAQVPTFRWHLDLQLVGEGIAVPANNVRRLLFGFGPGRSHLGFWHDCAFFFVSEVLVNQ